MQVWSTRCEQWRQVKASRIFLEMALLRYLKSVDGLPDPRGLLSTSIPSSAIEEANAQVQKVMGAKWKRGPYQTYSPRLCFKIGEYTCRHGVPSAARYFSRKLNCHVSETTQRSIKDSYKIEVWGLTNRTNWVASSKEAWPTFVAWAGYGWKSSVVSPLWLSWLQQEEYCLNAIRECWQNVVVTLN